MLNCIIVDDQLTNIEIIEEHIKKMPELKLLQKFTKSVEALTFLENNSVDIAFLDIQMPNLTGMEIIESLRYRPGDSLPSFILTTGFKEYAVSAFEFGVEDYLVKPVGFKRFKMSLERVIIRKKMNTATINKAIEKEYFFIESDSVKFKLLFDDIAYIESSGNYIDIFGPRIKKMTVYNKPLNFIEGILPSNEFLRVHKSFIVSVKYIDKLKQNEFILNNLGNEIKCIPIGPKYKEAIMKFLGL